ncbi:MAG: SusC/RagA family TonB-linked outer membrane protein, partial [Bacteroidales bacterium]|nr:SusC/RagA family TonB-linked outer membrane protein [Bacteroidales bacterium]
MYVKTKIGYLLNRIVVAIVLVLCTGTIYAQNITVTGRITDNSGAPIPGAAVMIKGTRTVTPADMDGNYRISAPSNAILEFSFLGMVTVEQVVGGRAIIDVVLQEDAISLASAVVIGYGTQRRENLTGAVASVQVDKTLGSRPIADVGRGLQGSVPGLTVRIQSGEIGSDPVMRIRGQVASLQGNANPLILLDNVEIPSIQIINPDDIESISVLKDAASSAIYGAKAAFGVILITTKKGAKRESVTVSYSNNFSWQNRAKELNMAGIDGLQYTLDASRTRNPEDPRLEYAGTFWSMSQESIDRAKEWALKYGNTIKSNDPVVYGRDWYWNGSQMYGYRLYNAVDALVANWTPTQNHSLSVNGLSGKTGFNIGIGLLDQSGMTKPAKIDDYKRYNVSINVSTEVNKHISIQAGALYSDRNKRYPSVGSVTAGDPWVYAYRWGPLFPVGTKDQHGNNLREPAYEFANTTTSNLQNVYTNVNLGTTIKFTQNWNLQFKYTHVKREDIVNSSIPTYTFADSWRFQAAPQPWNDEHGNRIYVDDGGNIVSTGGVPAFRFTPITYWANAAPGQTSSVYRESISRNQGVYDLFSTYNLDLNNQHSLKFMAGLNATTSDFQMHSARRYDLTSFENPQFSFATGEQFVGGNAGWESGLGFFGRMNYAFSDKYLVEANLRYDGSSKFPKHLRWQLFPSFSAGWVITNENFMQGLSPTLNFAKARASWGQLGDMSVSGSLYVPTMTRHTTGWLDSAGEPLIGYRAPSIVSSDIKWQTIQTFNVGIDLRMIRHKLGITFDWYQRDTKDMIIGGDALPVTLGAGAPQGNFGNLRTRGFEVAVDFNHRFTNGIGINVMATLFDAVSHVTKGADWRTPWEDRLISSNWSTGARFGDIWGYVTDRLYQEDDFVKDPNLNTRTGFKKVTIIIDGVARQSYMLAGANPVYQS